MDVVYWISNDRQLRWSISNWIRWWPCSSFISFVSLSVVYTKSLETEKQSPYLFFWFGGGREKATKCVRFVLSFTPTDRIDFICVFSTPGGMNHLLWCHWLFIVVPLLSTGVDQRVARPSVRWCGIKQQNRGGSFSFRVFVFAILGILLFLRVRMRCISTSMNVTPSNFLSSDDCRARNFCRLPNRDGRWRRRWLNEAIGNHETDREDSSRSKKDEKALPFGSDRPLRIFFSNRRTRSMQMNDNVDDEPWSRSSRRSFAFIQHGGDYSTVQQQPTTTTIDNKYVIDRMSPFKVTQSLTSSTSFWFSRFYRRVHFSTHLCNPAISR